MTNIYCFFVFKENRIYTTYFLFSSLDIKHNKTINLPNMIGY